MSGSPESAAADLLARINTKIPHAARIYDYLLGGKDNYAADREAAEQLIKLSPGTREGVRAHRDFLRRAVHHLAVKEEMAQFLDIGTGIPTQGNTHEVAQQANARARVAYVDNDPIVLVHGRALLTGSPTGRTSVIEADLREPKTILSHPQVREVVDFDRPVAVVLVGVMHFITDDEAPYDLVEQYKAAVPSGSCLLLSHITLDFAPDLSEKFTKPYDKSTAPMVPRTKAQVERFFEGWQLVDPGVVEVVQWRPDRYQEPIPGDGHAWAYGGVAVKP
ncbi:SAM-dependent methyltransferase [Sphaerisporangium sp. TRM90804]|uniref:SAM-dependent methyltransferase n=1 Tax=Sphaerisporangium sp. TRM90804 TaxID=3031113 RepID=UPI00244D63D3|nr:SAM-dependent methyltransferase [Sphaerisporangium sp. TRM90804]MDH2430758.1 SAM-dependent methyltransferase [Sphaerisporangium sp. TRM90804]